MRTIAFGKPILGVEEKKAVAKVLEGDILVHGPVAKEFEAAFAKWTNAQHATSVSSCTAALHLSWFYFGLKPGDEVIVPAQTHTATAHAVELMGAKPVFVDAEIKTGNIDLDQIENSITNKTKGISIVHFLGMPVNMHQLMQVAKKYNLFVVEDCALAIGTYFDEVHAGLYGDIGCFSFYPIKHLTTAEGGMCLTRHHVVAQKLSLQKALGVDRTVQERTIPGIYDVPTLGFNYRMNEIGAAIGIEQLKRAQSFLDSRKKNHEHLQSALKSVDEIALFESSHGPYQSSYYCLSVLLSEKLQNKRFEMIEYLKSQGVGTSVYYPRPVPHFTYYKEKYGYSEKSFPVASKVSYGSIALSVGPHLNLEDMDYTVLKIKEAILKVR